MSTTPEIIVIAHNIRSTHNIGSIFRTAEGFGVSKLILSGYSPYPTVAGDTRLPHLSRKLSDQIHKTALGAEKTLAFEYYEEPPLDNLKDEGYTLIALEQSPRSQMLPGFTPVPHKCALILGEEVHGIEARILAQCDHVIEIPMRGTKESFNVSVATGIALYGLLYNNGSFAENVRKLDS